MKPLDGKAIVITGAGGGLGAAYARHAASLGAAVVVNDIDAQAAQSTVDGVTAAGGHAVAAPGDVASWDFARMLIAACERSFGAFTGYVNNAGILRPARLEDASESDLRRMFEINWLATASGAQAAARRLKEIARGGSIINVASGSQAGDIGLGGYGATKAAIASLTYSWAMELRDSGIRMNAISPLADTAMAAQNRHLMAIQAANREVHYPTMPPADGNAPLVSFLLSDAASGINGQLVRIAGRQLSFVTHPMIAAPVLEDDWTFENIAAAFRNTFGPRQHPLGLGYASA